MPRSQRDRESEPMTLGQALAAKVRLIVWCKSCGHQAEPDDQRSIELQCKQHARGPGERAPCA